MKTSPDEIKIIIVDDHRLFNDGLHGMLKSEEGINVLAQVYDSREAENIIQELHPGCGPTSIDRPMRANTAKA